jgi:hypothetical protein
MSVEGATNHPDSYPNRDRGLQRSHSAPGQKILHILHDQGDTELIHSRPGADIAPEVIPWQETPHQGHLK